MKKCLASLVFLLSCTTVFPQKVNTDAIAKFWQLVDTLKHGRPLGDSLWEAYYTLPGNRNYMLSNRDLGEVAECRRYMAFVFNPLLEDSLNALQRAGEASTDDILDNLLYIKAHEEALRSYTTLVTSPAYLQACIRLAKEYLPQGRAKSIPQDLAIYMMAMTFDAAVQGKAMYFGLARVYEYDRFRKGALAAHEFHHQMRPVRTLRRAVSPADSASFSAIDDINNEGSADLVDKMLLLDHPGQVFRGAGTMHRLMDKAPGAVARLDSCFRLNAQATPAYVTAGRFGQIMRYSSGHLPGLYMVSIIRRNGLEKALIARNDNPFNFFYLYNEAAKKDAAKPPLFSAAAMAYLKQLEKRCL